MVHKDIEKVVVLAVDVRGPHDEVFRVHVLEEVHPIFLAARAGA